MTEEQKRRLRNQVGNTSHKDCRNSYCEGHKTKKKTEHVFCEDDGYWSTKFYWKCMTCGQETRVAD